MRTRRTVLGTVALVGLAGCGSTGDSTTGTDERDDSTTAADAQAGSTPGDGETFWYTHPQPTGNRRIEGSGAIHESDAVTFEPGGRPQWLVAHPGPDGSHWTVATTDGEVSHWRVADGTASELASGESIPPETQPVVATGDGEHRLLQPPAGMADRSSPLVDPPTADGPARLVSLGADGDLVVGGSEPARLDVNALTDGRLAAVGDGRYALFADPTDRYRHGALGDTTEGTTLVVVDARRATVVSETTLDPPTVFEGLQPLVADIDDDGEPEIVTTVADSSNGARIAVFSPEGDRVATGPIHEPGWRHQLAVAPFGPGGASELAVVRKPHVEHVLEFYRLRDGALEVVATTDGFSSHTYGSRNLDGAVAGDFDGDGTTELLVPTTRRDALAAVRRISDGARVVWELPLDGALTSNVTGVQIGGGLAVGAATREAVHVWQV